MCYIRDDLFTSSRQVISLRFVGESMFAVVTLSADGYLIKWLLFVMNSWWLVNLLASFFITVMKQLICQHWKAAHDRQGRPCAFRSNHLTYFGLITLIWQLIDYLTGYCVVYVLRYTRQGIGVIFFFEITIYVTLVSIVY